MQLISRPVNNSSLHELLLRFGYHNVQREPSHCYYSNGPWPFLTLDPDAQYPSGVDDTTRLLRLIFQQGQKEGFNEGKATAIKAVSKLISDTITNDTTLCNPY